MIRAIAVASFFLAASVTAAPPRRPFPQPTPYAAGTIRPSHRTQAQLNDDVRAYYADWKQKFLIAAGSNAAGAPLYRVSFGSTNPGRTVSEGQGYGMIITAIMAGHDPDAQRLFDGLWLFSRQYPSTIDSRLMGWQIPIAGDGNANAFDGDADIAYALLLADAQWGNGGAIDYRREALTVIAGILESTIGPQSHLPTLGDWVRFDGATHNQFTPRSSDLMTGHFRAFAHATGSPAWTQVVAATQNLITSIQENHSPNTGLLPDFIVDADTSPRPAPPDFLEAATDGDYNYNAGRDPWRIGTDAVLSGDAVSLAQVRKITRWIRTAAAGDPLRIRSGYRLDGTPLPQGNYFTIFFVAPFAVAAMSDPSQQQWLNDLYDAVYRRHEDYYEDSVALLSLMTLTGNMWSPVTSARSRRRAVGR